MQDGTKVELMAAVMKGFLGATRFIDKVEKGLNDLMAPVVIDDKEFEEDVADLISSVEEEENEFDSEVDEAHCLKIISANMGDAIDALDKQVAELEEAAWTVESVVMRWETASPGSQFYDPETDIWVVTSYVVYS